ncbi:MAG: methyl-accepting chemotaxis protein [Pseudomonadota bacterium]|nr:methyl-accepting chemotaxis protein [Pseudomonadota bacterium]
MNKLLDNLPLSRKFLLLGLLGCVLMLVPAVLYLDAERQESAAARLESQGIPPLRVALEAVRLTQRHRGLSAIVLNGDAATEAGRAQIQQQSEAVYARLDQLLQQDHATGIIPDALLARWTQAHQDWRDTAAAIAGHRLDAAESFRRHTALVTELLTVSDGLADAYGLSLDPGADTSHAIAAASQQLPALTEVLGQLRAKGSALLTSRRITPTDRATVASLAERASRTSIRLQGEIAKVTALRPELAATLRDALDEARSAGDSIVVLAGSSIVDAAEPTLPAAAFFARASQGIDAQFAIEDRLLPWIDQALAVRLASVQRRAAGMAGLLLVVSVLAGALGILIARSIGRGLDEAVQLAARVAEGDLRAHAGVRRSDELGSMLEALQAMSAHLQHTVGQVLDGAGRLSGASAQARQGSGDVAAAAERQHRAAAAMAATVEEISASVRGVAEQARQVSEVASASADLSSDGQRRLGELTRQIAGVSDVVTAIGGDIETFIAQVGEIAGMTRQVKDIAEQTNLLALNAAIEAARAGDQGRGFAVVADEVRKLAEKSSQSASHIDAITARLDSQSQQLGRAVTASRSAIEASREHVVGVTAALDKACAAVAQASEGCGEISLAVGEQSVATEQLAHSLSHTAALAGDARAASAQLDGTAGELDVLVHDLQSAVASFRVA